MLHRSAKAGAPEPLIEVKKIKTIYKKQCELPPNHQDNFAVSAPEVTLAVPDPNIPPIEPIIRDMYCPYQPEEDPTHMKHEDKSREYENTLAVPDPNIPPIEPIIRDMYCPYQPEEDPTHMIHEDKSCLSKPEVNNT